VKEEKRYHIERVFRSYGFGAGGGDKTGTAISSAGICAPFPSGMTIELGAPSTEAEEER